MKNKKMLITNYEGKKSPSISQKERFVYTQKLYLDDSRLQGFRAEVLECREISGGFQVVLDKTAFFAEAGGQPSDSGEIIALDKAIKAKVLKVLELDKVIYHFTNMPLAVGGAVEGQIDWRRRFDFMQQHSGEHIISGIIKNKYGLNNVGFHIGADYVTVDFDGVLTEAALAEIESEANNAVYQNIEVSSYYPEQEQLTKMDFRSKVDREAAIRVVSIPGYDSCACCGMHVSMTCEIGIIKILSAKRYKQGSRIELVSGGRAFKDYGRKHRFAVEASVALSAKPNEVDLALRRLIEERDVLKAGLGAIKEQALTQKSNELYLVLENSKELYPGLGYVTIADNLQPAEARKICLLLSAKIHKNYALNRASEPAWLAVLSSLEGNRCIFVVAGIKESCTDSSSSFNAGTATRQGSQGPGSGAITSQSVEDGAKNCATRHGLKACDAEAVANYILKVCGGKGGGNGALSQGTADADSNTVAAALAKWEV